MTGPERWSCKEGIQEEGDDVNASKYMMCHRHRPEREGSKKPRSPDPPTLRLNGAKKFLEEEEKYGWVGWM